MRLPNWFRIVWWIIILAVTTFVLRARYNSIISGNSTTVDALLIFIWFALLLLPLFQEVELFGVKFKSYLDTLKSEIKSDILNVRSEIQNFAAINTQISPSIHLTPPPDYQLPVLEEKFREILEEVMKKQPSPTFAAREEAIRAPDKATYLFSVRYTIEQEIKRILGLLFSETEIKKGHSIHHMLNMVAKEAIPPEMVDMIKSIYAICSLAMHGEQVTEDQFRFISEIAPRLIASLKTLG